MEENASYGLDETTRNTGRLAGARTLSATARAASDVESPTYISPIPTYDTGASGYMFVMSNVDGARR